MIFKHKKKYMNVLEDNTFRVKVKSGSNEIEVTIPLTPRNEVGMDSNGTGRRALLIVEELIEKIKKI